MSKFSFKKVKGSSKYLTWKKWLCGDYLIGKFVEEGQDQFGNPSYRTEVIETSLEDVEEGDTFTLNSNGALNYKMEDVNKGDIIRVEYLGEDILDNPKSPFNGKPYHKVELEVAEEAHMADINAAKIKETQDKAQAETEDQDYGEDL